MHELSFATQRLHWGGPADGRDVEALTRLATKPLLDTHWNHWQLVMTFGHAWIVDQGGAPPSLVQSWTAAGSEAAETGKVTNPLRVLLQAAADAGWTLFGLAQWRDDRGVQLVPQHIRKEEFKHMVRASAYRTAAQRSTPDAFRLWWSG
eukprot:502536-Amphidinium_carterae.1